MALVDVVTLTQASASQVQQIINLLKGVMTDQPVTFGNTISATAVQASGLSGATAVGRYVGVTSSGAPASGTFAIGDWVTTRDGRIWMCTTAGTPGTWVQPSPPPNTNPANIQPVGTVAAAGSTGLSADAGHVHTGAGLTSANNSWSGNNIYGAALSGSAMSTFVTVNPGGGMGGSSGNFSAVIESLGIIQGNTIALGFRAYRDGAGSDWNTTNLIISMDVDNTYAAGTRLALTHGKFFGINVNNPSYLLDIFNPSGSRVAYMDSTGSIVFSSAVQASQVNGITGLGGSTPIDPAWGGGSAGGSGYASRESHQHSDLYLVRGGAPSAPSDTEAKHLWTANSRNDTYVSAGDILFNA